MSFEASVGDRQRTAGDRHPTITKAHHEPMAQVSLKDSVFQQLMGNMMALGSWVSQLRMTDQLSGTICEILVECIMRNSSVNLF